MGRHTEGIVDGGEGSAGWEPWRVLDLKLPIT